jgi:hypothetical protein
VRDDWRAWLPEAKARVHESCTLELETLYNMLSISLDEALEMRNRGNLSKAYEAARIAQGVCMRFGQSLEAVLSGLHRHVKHFSVVPNTAPLDPENFRGARGQRTAKITGFLNRVLLSHRSQFIHKTSILREMVTTLRDEFCRVVDELVSGIHLRTDAFWQALDQSHFDLNTCLRETFVLLKSFLVVLPEDQISSFESSLKIASARTTRPAFALRHRRFAAVPGK